MVDALAAASEKVKTLESQPLKQALPEIAATVMQGAEKTKQMIAVFDRVKNLGERAIGHMDPGAVSMAYILKYMNQARQ